MVPSRIWVRNTAGSRMSSHKSMQTGREAVLAGLAETAAAKREIRSRMKRLRQELSEAEKQAMDEAICEHMLEVFGKNRQSVYCYVSYGTEIDTRNLIRTLLRQGVSVAVPRVDDTEENRMNFYWITGMEDLTAGYRGIPEPGMHCRKADDRQAPVFTPGLAFTKDGARLGYGGGYYDRFFAGEPEHLRIAAAYPFQILDTLPTESTDFRVQKIVTGETMMECRK